MTAPTDRPAQSTAAGTFRRRVTFEPGYNYLHETGPKQRGQHGMAVRFVLIGPHGAVQFLFNTSWTPLGPVDEKAQGREPCHIDYWRPSGFEGHYFGTVNAPMGYDIGHHWRTPTYEGEGQYGDHCSFNGGGPCFYDGSGLRADDVLRDFIAKGERAVWRHLVAEYRYCLTAAAEAAQGVPA